MEQHFKVVLILLGWCLVSALMGLTSMTSMILWAVRLRMARTPKEGFVLHEISNLTEYNRMLEFNQDIILRKEHCEKNDHDTGLCGYFYFSTRAGISKSRF